MMINAQMENSQTGAFAPVPAAKPAAGGPITKNVSNTGPLNTTATSNNAAQTCSADDFYALIGERLSLPAFHQLAGQMAGYSFVKIVVERPADGNVGGQVHFIKDAKYPFHADYIAERIMGVPREQVRARIDDYNRSFYLVPDRKYFLGILSLHTRSQGQFFALETVEIDNMDDDMLLGFYQTVKANIDASLPLFFKPANHCQEQMVTHIDAATLPRMYNHELFGAADYVPLNKGIASGRLRIFDERTYERELASIKWYDIIVMERVPDSIPRVSGIINAQHTTPLSHTNVLACGWGIPNAIQLGITKRLRDENMDGAWVEYTVDPKANAVSLTKTAAPTTPLERPRWSAQQIRLEEPEVENTPIRPLESLRMSDRFRYGTKAANLGELRHVLDHGSARLIGFYRIPRAPRPNLLQHLAELLHVPCDDKLAENAWQYLRHSVEVPRGIAIPFSVQQEFLESSPKIQQAVGKLKMALELNAREVDAHCVLLQNLIRNTRMSDKLRDYIDEQIAEHLGGVSSFVIRSSSNAEDLKDFSAAGIYESINHVTTADKIFESIKEVWASLVSPRSVRLRHEVGISLDDCYMGVIIQEEIGADFGGVLVTVNPMNTTGDFRNVYINASERSAIEVVGGHSLPYQYLYNTVEGGGRTLSLGNAKVDLPPEKIATMQNLALCGRLLQAHFSQNYTFSTPADIEWAAKDGKIFILQLRPYAV